MALNKGINIPVGFDVSPLKTSGQEAANVVKQSTEQISQVTQQAAGKTNNSLKTIQQEYRTTYRDAQKLAQQLGTDSQAFHEAARAAAQYRDQLDDVNDVINAYHPEKKWQMTGQAISAAVDIANGFVGAMTLIGVEAKTADEAIKTMMALNAISGAILAMEQLKGAWVALSATINAATVSANGFWAALIKPAKILGTVLAGAAVLLGISQEVGENSARFNRTNEEVVKLIQAQITESKKKTNEIKEQNKELKKQQEIIYNGLPETQSIQGVVGLRGGGGQFSAPRPSPITDFIEGAKNEMSGFQIYLQSFAEMFSQIKGIVVGAAGEMAFSIGQMLAGENYNFSGLAILAEMMNTVANAALATGTAYLALPGMQGIGAAAIAAGLALKTAAGFVSAKAGAGSVSGGAPTTNYSAGGFSPMFQGAGGIYILDSTVRGQDLVISTRNTDRNNRRVR